MERKRQAWLAWASVSLLAVLCAVVAVLQYRWIGGISEAERQRLQSHLQVQLDSLRRNFNDAIVSPARALLPDNDLIDRSGWEVAFGYQYTRWKQSHAPLFRQIGVAVPRDGSLAHYNMDLESGRLVESAWPAGWNSLRDRLTARLNRVPLGPHDARDYALFELPRFGPDPGGGMHEQEWLILELDLAYIRGTLVPELLARYLPDYDAEIAVNQAPDVIVYPAAETANQRIGPKADASVTLLDNPGGGRGEPGGPPPGANFQGGRPLGMDFEKGPGRRGFGGPPAPPAQRVQVEPWRLSVRHKSGSLEALVRQTRLRNLIVSAGLLLLIVATSAMLVRFSRQAQRLAEMQMDFVAGVSHELRTPLTVIRTAAFNLRGKMSHMPEQVERYGRLIQDEAEKLGALMEQVLSFSRTRAGAAIREPAPVPVSELIDRCLDSAIRGKQQSGLVVEKQIPADLPCVLADEMALRHALLNLIENAVKYGTEGSNWIGIFASEVADAKGPAVEIRIADRGPGIPHDELERIFDPFFRGRRALRDQLHGTGLGLSIVKKTIEAHGGSVRAHSTPGSLTEFILRLPLI
jgi:signal transduction histidine kinase